MHSPTLYDQIDRDLEKQVFLTDAEEGNYGLYSLVWELGAYTALSIGEKYTLAKDLLKELVTDGLLMIEEFEDSELKNKLRTIRPEDLDTVLNNPTSWYPGQRPALVTALTPKGNAFMDARDEQSMKRLDSRLLASKL